VINSSKVKKDKSIVFDKQICILVLGMHRSGTSALTGVLSLLDVYLGSELMKENFANEKGYFENNKLYRINEKLLAECNSSWDDTFYSKEKLNKLSSFDELKEAIKAEFEFSKIFAIKDPRLAFLFPVYEQVLKEMDVDVKVILPYRNPVEVASSLNTRDAMSMEKGMLLWGYHFLQAEKFSRGYERVFLGFDELMNNTAETIKKIDAKLHIDLYEKYEDNKEKIDDFLEPDLKHHNISIDNLSDNVPAIVKKVLTLKDKFDKKVTYKEFDKIYDEFFSYQKLFYNREIISFLEELHKTKETLTQKEQALHVKSEELNKTKETLTQKEQALHVKSEELNKTKETLTQKEQALHVKSEELNKTKETLTQKEQALHVKSEELNKTKETLTQKEQALHVKSEELNKTKETLTQKDKLISKQQKEIEALKDELVLFYEDSTCILAKTIRKVKGILK